MKLIESLLNGEPWILEDTDVTPYVCCDCNLTHMVAVYVDYEKKNVKLKFYRDDYQTKKFRKENNIVVYRKKIK